MIGGSGEIVPFGDTGGREPPFLDPFVYVTNSDATAFDMRLVV
ncbi:MAG: hypothetical protein ACI9YT_002305 [Halobacteriales archaeon]